MEKLQNIELTIGDETEDGVFAVSLVEKPAIEKDFIALSKEEIKLKVIDEDKRNYVAEQVTEIIYAIVSECYDTIKTHDDFDTFVLDDVKEMSKMKRRDYKSLTSKCIFKMMDLIDMMKQLLYI